MRPAVKEQIQSLGAKFVELPLETAGAEDKGGYAKAQDESFYQQPARADGQGRSAASDMVHHDGGDPRQEVAGADHRRRW